MKRLFTGVRAPSTLGTFLRRLTFGHVRQLDAAASRLLINLAGQAPLLPGATELAHVDADAPDLRVRQAGRWRRLHRCEGPERAACGRLDAGRLAHSARRPTLHQPAAWPWQTAWQHLAAAANSPPLAA